MATESDDRAETPAAVSGPDAEAVFAALVRLHRGLPRQGPGDLATTLEVLGRLPAFGPNAHIADMGCGTGAASMVLARHFGAVVHAVDRSQAFLDELAVNAREAGLGHLIQPVVGDMTDLGWPDASVDLIWSEGAVYTVGFEAALRTWRALIKPGGVAVVSEMCWFVDDAPEPPRAFWREAYPEMASEGANRERANRAGYEVLFTERLPERAWWANYYGPLRTRMHALKPGEIPADLLRETETEIALFERYSDCYGYTFFALKPVE